MAKTDIGPKISVEGEKEYRQQMQNIIARQKEYAAELKSTTASMDENTSAEQRASSVAAVLRKQIAAQTDAMNAQKSMLLQATEKYGSASTQASAYRTAVYKTNAELETLKSRLRDAENGLGEFASKADGAKGSLDGLTNTDAGSGMFDGLQSAVTKGSIAANLFSKVSSTIVAAGKQVVSTGVQYNAQLEQYQTALTNMLGSEAEAVALLDEIKQDAAKTPFDTAGLVKANELLISTGIDAESSRRTILALGDAVSATGGGNEELSRMAQNLQQIRNAGKATSADIKQFAYAGIDVYGILADYTGKSAEEVQKMTVTYDLLSNALISAADEGGRYFNSMSTQSETLNGQWSTLKDNATQLAGLMTGDLTDGIKIVVGHMNDLTVAASEAYDTGGWFGLADAIASNIPIVSELKTGFENATTAAINFLDRASYALNKGLGKNAYAGYNSYEDYQKDQKKKSSQTEEARRKAREERGRKHAERVRQAQAEAASNYIVPTYNDSGSSGSGKKKTTKKTSTKTAQDTKKLAKSITNTSKQLLQGTENVVGAISRTVETADNTYNVYDGTTKKLKGTTTQTVQTITDSWTEMVNGVETQFKRVQTLTDGVVTSEKVTSSIADEVAKKSVHTRAETLTAAQAEIDEAIGYVSRTAKTSTETKKVLNAETGELKDTVVSATKVVTDCYKRIVDGQEQTVERTTTYTNGIVTDVNEKVTDLNTSIKYTEGALGGFSKFVLDLDTKLGGLEKVASNLTKSPLGQWFSDLSKGYRASDSFWDNIDVVGTLVGGLTGAAQGFQLTGSWQGAVAGGVIGIVGKLLGTSISTQAGSWGADLVSGLASGITSGGGIIAKAVSWIGDIIKGFLHFSRPDEGPLREYESWMPDMIQGMADGIRNNAYLLQDAAADLGRKLKMQLQYDVGSANGFAQVATNSRTVSMGGINVNVYPSEGMDEERFAQYTITRLTQMINEEAAASGEVPVF